MGTRVPACCSRTGAVVIARTRPAGRASRHGANIPLLAGAAALLEQCFQQLLIGQALWQGGLAGRSVMACSGEWGRSGGLPLMPCRRLPTSDSAPTQPPHLGAPASPW
jgi:hypothetical protein